MEIGNLLKWDIKGSIEYIKLQISPNVFDGRDSRYNNDITLYYYNNNRVPFINRLMP